MTGKNIKKSWNLEEVLNAKFIHKWHKVFDFKFNQKI